jgi:hypothetical protein
VNPGCKNPNSGYRMEKSRSGIQDGKIQIRNLGWKNPDPRSGTEKSRSEINIPNLR